MRDQKVTFDGDLPITSAQCFSCAHFIGFVDGKNQCKAFADIPADIWTLKFDHKQPYAGDGGVRFKQYQRPKAA